MAKRFSSFYYVHRTRTFGEMEISQGYGSAIDIHTYMPLKHGNI